MTCLFPELFRITSPRGPIPATSTESCGTLCRETGAASIEPWTSFANTRWALERLLFDAGLGGLEKHVMRCTSMQLGQTHGRSATHGAYIPLSFRSFLRTVTPGR
jgi:hypothetical protein